MKRDYTAMINQKFGKLTLTGITELQGANNRKSRLFHFLCECGVKKDFIGGRVNQVFRGATVSCGCFRKAKWAKSYDAWKKDWESKESP